MIGGFLGAGKTTAVVKLGRWLAAQGRRVGLIDNDQGSGLVDTALIASHGLPVEEISGGCFCCRFASLVEAASKLEERARPEVFIAEPVGSCTDLVATVTYPLRRLYGDRYSIAPLSVLVDPTRAARLLGLESGTRFSPKVEYIYRKQLEEADLIVINKSDLLSSERRGSLRNSLATEFPKAEILLVSARTGDGLEDWFQRITSTLQAGRETMAVDYEVYAEGEALLGWLNASFQFEAPAPVPADHILRRLAEAIQGGIQSTGGEIAHLKMTLEPNDSIGDLAVINLVRNDYVPELSQTCESPVTNGYITVNLRAEAAPELLREILEMAALELVASAPYTILKIEHLESFRPGKPQPTHRMASTA